jgi:hypothetical protein
VGCLLAGAAVLAVVQWVFKLSLPMPIPSPREARAGRIGLLLAILANYTFVIIQTRSGWQ